ncbi:HAD family hydrolase [Paenibacillus sp. LHD-117]|uniref:HAD family hydrolase n=1 Tax=Paenibacillus sp. LHD-117 TaxID=3071412 RepID=UPI0027E0BB36|nr:HAD family hydrolase [Paenibacillus sp. LHD-117]MDQ6420528.1 HAD family hydrolase [Paenibacillus sp. LHD-117]
MKISAVALDLDGTLLNGRKQVSERNLQAVLSCLDHGLRLIIATARPPRSVKELLPRELLDRSACVYYNGAIVRDTGAGIDEHRPLSNKLTATIVNFCAERFPDAHLSLEVNDLWYANREVADAAFYHSKFRPELASAEELASRAATKILISELEESEQLSREFAHSTRFVVTDGGKLIQIMNPSVSKATGIARLCGHYGIETAQVAVFGDDHNDLDMFRMAGHAVAMGNAVPELKTIASETTASNDDDGVALVLERLLARSV